MVFLGRTRDHQTGSESMFVFAIVVFVFDKFQQGADGGSNRTHNPICLAKRDLCVEIRCSEAAYFECEVEFWEVLCLEEGTFDYFYCGSINH